METVNHLRTLRRRASLSQIGLSVKANVATTVIHSIERWGYRPSDQVCQRIAAALGMTVEEIWPAGQATGEQDGVVKMA